LEQSNGISTKVAKQVGNSEYVGLFRSYMPVVDEGYKCSVCGDTFLSSTSAKKHVNFSKACWQAGQVPKVLPYRIVTGQSDRRVGGRDTLHIQSKQRNVSKDFHIESDHDLELVHEDLVQPGEFSDVSTSRRDSGI
jgi:hypothetical protein